MHSRKPLEKPQLLFLCHRIPYPPNKGDKIRSFHLLHHLSLHFDIHLACFIDDPADKPWVHEVEKFCVSSLFVELAPTRARMRSITGLFSGAPLSVPYYRSSSITNWVAKTVARCNVRRAIVFSSPMAQFVEPIVDQLQRSVVDFVDVDSDKWQQYAETRRWPMNWLYRREARHLLRYEAHLGRLFDAGLFVSETEAELFKRLVPESAGKIGFYNNGVNSEYFDPAVSLPNPYPRGIRPLVFTGAMDYWPNVDAVVWFCEHVLPRAREDCPDLHFYVVGSNPTRAVQDLASMPGVMVTGRVDDIRPYLAYALAAVAPMRIARGVQNKVLEAMAMMKLVLVSEKGIEGIAADDTNHLLLANSREQYLQWISRILKEPELQDIGVRARQFVQTHFNWERNLPEVVLLLDEAAAGAPREGIKTDE